MKCKVCGSEDIHKNGKMNIHGVGEIQRYNCKNCGKNFPDPNIVADSGLKGKTVLVANTTSTVDAIIKPTPTPPPTKQSGLTEKQLRERFDIRYIVSQSCEKLKSGTFLTTSEFIQFCGFTAGTRYRDIIDHPDYEDYRGKNGGNVFWSSRESILKMKNEGILM